MLYLIFAIPILWVLMTLAIWVTISRRINDVLEESDNDVELYKEQEYPERLIQDKED